MYWYDWEHWCVVEKDIRAGLANKYSSHELEDHEKISSEWERLALNAPTQGTGSIIIKYAATKFFNWIVDNNLFGTVLLCNMVHDEIIIEYPKEYNSSISDKLKECMESSASKFCKKLPIPAEPALGDHWIH